MNNEDYKGIYYKEESEHHFYEYGAHFKYSSLYNILKQLQKFQKIENKEQKEIKENKEEYPLINFPKKIAFFHIRNNSDVMNNKKKIKIKNSFHSIDDISKDKINNKSSSLSLSKKKDFSFKNNSKINININNNINNYFKIKKNQSIKNFIQLKNVNNKSIKDYDSRKNSFMVLINNSLEKNKELDSRNKKTISYKTINQGINTNSINNNNFQIKEVRIFHSIGKKNNYNINYNIMNYNNKYKINKIKVDLLKENSNIKTKNPFINSYLNNPIFNNYILENNKFNSRNIRKIKKSNSQLFNQKRIFDKDFFQKLKQNK